MSARIRIGTQGWNYDAWVGPFYPSGTRPAEFLGEVATWDHAEASLKQALQAADHGLNGLRHATG